MNAKIKKESADGVLRSFWWCLRSVYAECDYTSDLKASIGKTIIPYVGNIGRVSDFYSDYGYGIITGFEL